MTSCMSNQQHQLLEQINASDDDDIDSDVDAESPVLEFSSGETEFNFPHSSTCWVCNGYYGPNFGEPLCGPCHAFLYNAQRAEEFLTELSDDDEDSGNDEPPFKDKQEDDEAETENDADIMGFEDIEAADNNPVEAPAALLEQHAQLDEGHQQQHHAVEPRHMSPERQYEQERAANAFLLPIKRPRPTGPPSLADYMQHLNNGHDRPHIYDGAMRADGGGAAAAGAGAQDKINALIPVELKLKIFAYLDDMSLWMASEVCQQWSDIITKNTSQIMWQTYVKQRWPLFRSLVEVEDWYKLYGALMSSAFCRTCLLELAIQATPHSEHDNAIRNNLLRNEAYLLNSYESEGIQAIPLGRQNNYWQATIFGPAGSPYEGGKFFLVIYFPEGYPMLPPTVRFLTKILHPNVSRHGDVGIDIFQQQNWSLALNVAKVLLSVQSLLTDPYTAVCMEPLLGYMYEHSRARFEQLARTWTWKYACHEVCIP